MSIKINLLQNIIGTTSDTHNDLLLKPQSGKLTTKLKGY